MDGIPAFSSFGQGFSDVDFGFNTKVVKIPSFHYGMTFKVVEGSIKDSSRIFEAYFYQWS